MSPGYEDYPAYWVIWIGATSFGELAARLAARISSLAARSRPLAAIDEQLIRALDASQAEGGLGSHVAAGAGEPCHG